MPPNLSLPAYLAIARMIARATPFDTELAHLFVEEVRREFLSEPEPAGEADVAPVRGPPVGTETLSEDTRRMIDTAIDEIGRRIADASTPIRQSIG